jgi:hypothetical protein
MKQPIEIVKPSVLASQVGGALSTEVSVTEDENPHSELMRLQKAQSKARQDEVFGGLSHAEQAEYNSRARRIHELDTQPRSSAGAKEGRG